MDGTWTDSTNGTYTVVVPVGTYYLRTWHNETNYVDEWWNGDSPDPSDYDCSLSEPITVVSGASIANTDFRLEEAATISGTVRDSAGTPVTGKRVSVDVFTGDPCNNTQFVEWAPTDPVDGTYTVVVPAGTYYLRTHYYETNYVNEWWNGDSLDPSDRDSGNGYVHALFDDVYVNNEATIYDDFATAPLDPTRWNSREMVREITDDHKLLLAAHSEGQREQSTLSFSEFQLYVEAKVIVKSESNVFNGAVGRVRIDGYFFNDTHGLGEYNGYEGNVWAQIYINLYDDGSLRAAGYVGKSRNSDESDWEDWFWDEFSIPIQTDREYTLGIHYTGSHFVFRCKDNFASVEQYKIYEIATTNQYPAYSQYTLLRTRTYGNVSGNGYMKVLVDDVYVVTGPAPSCPGDFDTDGDVDGSDLAFFAAGGGSITLEELAEDFGKTNCPQ